MKRIFLLIIACIYTLSWAEDLSLPQAVDLALANDPGLNAAAHELEGLGYEVREASSKYLPRLNLKGSYTRLNDPIDIQLDSLRSLIMSLETGNRLNDLNLQNLYLKGQELSDQEKAVYGSAISDKLESVIPSFDIDVLDQNLFRASIEAAIPIWMGGKIRALNRSARLRRDEGEIDCTRIRDQSAAETVRLYLTHQLMEESLVLAREAEAGIQEHRDRATSLYEAGLVARYQLQHAQVATSDARVRRQRAEEGVALSEAQLALQLGLDPGTQIRLTTPIEYMDPPPDKEKVWASIREKNPSLRKLAVKRELVKVKKRADLAEYLPQVYAFAKYEILRDDLSLLDPEWAAGVSLSFNLFSGGEKIHRLKADRQLALALNDRELQVERLLRQALEKLYHGIRAESATVGGFGSRLEEAQENLRLAESRFSSGMGISLEVVDARLTLQKIKLERLQAIYTHTLYTLKLNELAQTVERFVQQLEEKE